MSKNVEYHYADFPGFEQNEYIYQCVSQRSLTKITHSHDFYEIIYIAAGSVSQEINNEAYDTKAGDTVFLFPSETHCFLSQSDDASVVSLSVIPRRFAAITAAFGFEPASGRLLHCGPLSYSDYAVPIFTGEPDRRKLYFNMLLIRLLSYAFDDARALRISTIPAFLSNAVSSLSAPEHLREGVDFLMDSTGYSRSQVYRLVSRYYGETPHDIVTRLRMNVSQEFLTNTDMSLDEIAEMVGYASLSQFHTVFRKHFGSTPGEYRKQLFTHLTMI